MCPIFIACPNAAIVDGPFRLLAWRPHQVLLATDSPRCHEVVENIVLLSHRSIFGSPPPPPKGVNTVVVFLGCDCANQSVPENGEKERTLSVAASWCSPTIWMRMPTQASFGQGLGTMKGPPNTKKLSNQGEETARTENGLVGWTCLGTCRMAKIGNPTR